MDEIVKTALEEIETTGYTPAGNHLKTGDVRRISAKLYGRIKNEPAERIFSVCGGLLKQRSWAAGVIAYDFAFRAKKYYDAGTFAIFEGWLEKYVRGWGDCDDFCTHAFGELICRDARFADKTLGWAKRGEFWMRRAAAVVLIRSVWQDKYKETDPIRTTDLLMADGHHLVQKGYGWLLKILSVKEPELVYDYLAKHKKTMPRTAFRYALEKFDAEKKKELMG